MPVQLPGRPIQRLRRAVSRAGSDSLVGALGATFLGGPALGIGIGILSGKLNAQEIDRRAEDELLVREATSLFQDTLNEQRNRATTPEDLAQVQVLQQAYEYYSRLLAASSPQLQARGEAGMQKLLDAQLAYEARNEEQQIARVAADAAAEAAVGTQNWSVRSGLYDDLFRESGTFLDRRTAYGALRSAYRGVEQPGNIEDVAAINALQQLIDPGVSVREGDVTVLQNAAGVPDLLLTGANRVFNEGGRFRPEERRAMIEYANRLMTSANTEQIQNNKRFQEFGGAAGLPDNLIGTIRIPTVDIAVGHDENNYGMPEPSTQPASADNALEVVPVDGAMQRLVNEFTLPSVDPGEIGHFPPEVQNVIDDVAQGRRVMVDRAGRVYLQGAFETMQELTTTQEQRDEILRLQTGELTNEQFAEIRRRRRERSGANFGTITRFGPDDTTNPNRRRVTN